MRTADRGMVLQRFDSLPSACTPAPQKTPGKTQIQLPPGDISFCHLCNVGPRPTPNQGDKIRSLSRELPTTIKRRVISQRSEQL